ncbi:uncharacterized protein LOC124848511, partial [Vigna umbellata]|uniref:uncharacterized protein LOC124848511 n=1 Tax=Vigna umbellata TaxID=87088 RepID=UPI001F5F95A3
MVISRMLLGKDMCSSINNSSYKFFTTRKYRKSIQEGESGTNILKSEGKESNLLAKRFTRFLNTSETDINPKDVRKLCKDQHLQRTNLCMMVKSNTSEMCAEQGKKQSMWCLDNGCSRHMTGDPTRFISLSHKTSGHVTYGDNNKGKIVGK